MARISARQSHLSTNAVPPKKVIRPVNGGGNKSTPKPAAPHQWEQQRTKTMKSSAGPKPSGSSHKAHTNTTNRRTGK